MLDCTNRESILESVTSILGISFREIQKRLCSIVRRESALDAWLPGEIEGRFPLDGPHFEVCWFHGTRLRPGHTIFEDGLLPSRDAFERFILPWFFGRLRELGTDPDAGGPSRELTNKSWLHSEGYDLGPDGVLFPELIVRYDQSGYGDYLTAPEIVRVLCEKYGAAGERLLHEYQESTAQYIVKFVGHQNVDTDVMRRGALICALRWLYERDVMADDSSFVRFGYDGHGLAVPPGKIVAVDPLEAYLN